MNVYDPNRKKLSDELFAPSAPEYARRKVREARREKVNRAITLTWMILFALAAFFCCSVVVGPSGGVR